MPRDNNLVRWTKARTLISFLAIGTLTCTLSIPISKAVNSELPMALLAAVGIALLLLLKYTRSIYWIGNLSVAFLVVVFAHTSLHSGGIFSFDLAGMFLILIFAFSVLDLKATFFWTSIIIAFNFYVFGLSQNPETQTTFHEQHDGFPTAYFLKYNIVFLVVPAILLAMHKKLNIKLIKNLTKANSELDISNATLNEKSERLTVTKSDLENSISKLEQYAYTASHDLKQPIRTIISFTQLAEKRLNQLEIKDDDLTEYMRYVIKGTKDINERIEILLSDSTNPKVELREVVDEYF